MALNLSDALLQARRRAQLQGRPLSSAEMGGITSGWADSASARLARQRQLGIQEQSLAEQSRSNRANEGIATANREAQISAANKAALLGGIRDVGTAGLTYYGINKLYGNKNPSAPGTGGTVPGTMPALTGTGQMGSFGGVGVPSAAEIATGSLAPQYPLNADLIKYGPGIPSAEAISLGQVSPQAQVLPETPASLFNPGAMDAGAGAVPKTVPGGTIPGFSEAAAEGGTQSLTAGETLYDPMISGADAVPSGGFTPGPGTALAAYQASQMLGKSLQGQPWMPHEVSNILTHPITGLTTTPLEMAGLGNLAAPISKAEENFIQKPINYVAESIIPGGGGSCIVYGYFYGNKSREVRTAMIFCGEFMSKAKLLGYYSIGQHILIPAAKRWKWAHRFIKKVMAEPFYSFMQYKVGHRPETSRWSRAFAGMFLPLCQAYYHLGLPVYYPPGFEKCIRAAESRKPHEDLAEV